MYLITGATGNVGREIVRIFGAVNIEARALARQSINSELPKCIDVVAADLKNNPECLSQLFEGITAAFLNPAAIQEPEPFLEQAKKRGVKKIVLLSAIPVRDDLPLEQQPGFIARRHKGIEQTIEKSGMDWVHVRSNMLMSNAFFEVAPQIRRSDIYRGAYADAMEVPVDERDVAAVVARVLLEDKHAGSVYNLTGPEAISHRQKIALIAIAIKRQLAFEELTHAEAKSWIAASFPMQHSNGLGDEHIETVLRYMAESVGKPPLITDTVECICGRKATSYARWAMDNAHRFAVTS